MTSAIFGQSVAPAGDVDGDGFSDVIVGSSSYDNGQADEGRAFVYLGSATGPSATAGWTLEGDDADGDLGSAVAGAGDVNGDGYADLLVGADRYDSGETDEGKVFLYLGSHFLDLSNPAHPTKAVCYFSSHFTELCRHGYDCNSEIPISEDPFVDWIPKN